MDYSWFDSFYGKNDLISSRIILSFMAGNGNYGISLKRKDGTFLLTPVLGCLSQNNGIVEFGGDMNLVVHEFNQPYCNPLIEGNWSAIASKSEQVYRKVSGIMESQAYTSALTMMCETLVRACAIRYMLTHGMESQVEERIKYEEWDGFMMVRALMQTLEKRDQAAGKYVTLADFMPEIIKAINQFDPDASFDPYGTAEPDAFSGLPSSSISDGFFTSLRPVSSISKTPISFVEPNLLFTARSTL